MTGSPSQLLLQKSFSLFRKKSKTETSQNYVNESQLKESATRVGTETEWLEPNGFPLWLAILILTTVGSLLALATLVCSIKFKHKERQLQALRARLKQQQHQQQRQQCSSNLGSKYTNQRCMCLIALDQQRHKLQTSDVNAPTATAAVA